MSARLPRVHVQQFAGFIEHGSVIVQWWLVYMRAG